MVSPFSLRTILGGEEKKKKKTNLLPPPHNTPIPAQPLPRQRLHPLAHRSPLNILHLAGQRGPLRVEMPADQAEHAVGQDGWADVEQAGVAGAEGERFGREAVGGDVGVGGREEGAFGGGEGSERRRVGVRVVGSDGL